jgi:hypothetical protein
MAADERTTKIDIFAVVFFGVEVRYLANVVTGQSKLLSQWVGSGLPDGVKERFGYVLWTKAHMPTRIGFWLLDPILHHTTSHSLIKRTRHTPMILRLPFRPPLRPKHLSKTARNGRTLESNLAISRAIYVTHKHVHGRIVSALGESQHLVKVPGPSQEGEQAPKGASAERRPAHAVELGRTRDFEHGDAGADVDEEVGVVVGVAGDGGQGRGGLGEGVGGRLGVGEDFVLDLGYEEIEALEVRLDVVLPGGDTNLLSDTPSHLLS